MAVTQSDLERFRAALRDEYPRRFPRSFDYCRRREGAVLDQCSHAVRWNDPFMVTVARASGSRIEDLDGHSLVDYWQGHFANVLGHNPPVVTAVLARALAEGSGLQTGMLHELECEVAELLCRQTGQERVRFTTTGALGTFYATLLARGFTGRSGVLKVAGGWHGSQPFALKGIVSRDDSFDHLESEGLPRGLDEDVCLTRFNDVEDLRRIFRERGDRIACFILEPWLGSGGGIPAEPEYLREARRLTERHGALLICDEIITGFRFRAGDVSHLYGVRPDLLILGKIVGGGMPVAAVAGRADVLDLCSRRQGRVKFEGGTYSAHPLSLLAARTMITLLTEREAETYARLGELGEKLRSGLRRVFDEAGVPVFLGGCPNAAVPGSSFLLLHPGHAGARPTCAESLADPRHRHPWLTDALLKSALLLEGVSVRHGLGALSTAHTEEDLAVTCDGFRAVFRRFRAAGLL